MANNTKRTLSTSKPRKSDDVPEGYVLDPSVGPTYAYQRSLPHLPVPTLASTTSKYLETVQPHLTPEQYKKTKEAVESFAGSELAGKLQERLLQRAGDVEKHPNWLAEWWNEAAYMGYRGMPPPPFSSSLLLWRRVLCWRSLLRTLCRLPSHSSLTNSYLFIKQTQSWYSCPITLSTSKTSSAEHQKSAPPPLSKQCSPSVSS